MHSLKASIWISAQGSETNLNGTNISKKNEGTRALDADWRDTLSRWLVNAWLIFMFGYDMAARDNEAMESGTYLLSLLAAGTSLLGIVFWWQTRRAVYIAAELVFLAALAMTLPHIETGGMAFTIILMSFGTIYISLQSFAFLTQPHSGRTVRRYAMRTFGAFSIANVLIPVVLVLLTGIELPALLERAFNSMILAFAFCAFWNFRFADVRPPMNA